MRASIAWLVSSKPSYDSRVLWIDALTFIPIDGDAHDLNDSMRQASDEQGILDEFLPTDLASRETEVRYQGEAGVRCNNQADTTLAEIAERHLPFRQSYSAVFLRVTCS